MTAVTAIIDIQLKNRTTTMTGV